MARIEVEMSDEWRNCQHEWKEVESHLTDPARIEVECKKCGTPGEKWLATGEVDWPCT